MSHDPICQKYATSIVDGCYVCHLVAKARIDEREKTEAYYTNPCMSCGPMSEWSTYVCDECIKEYEQEFGGEQE